MNDDPQPEETIPDGDIDCGDPLAELEALRETPSTESAGRVRRGIGRCRLAAEITQAAVLIILLGSVLGQFAGRAVARSAEGSGLVFGPALGNVVSGLIFFVSVIMALGQLKIDTDIIRIVTVCCLSAAALAFGLSFGLGTRETMQNIIAGFYARKIFRAGRPMEIRGE